MADGVPNLKTEHFVLDSNHVGPEFYSDGDIVLFFEGIFGQSLE